MAVTYHHKSPTGIGDFVVYDRTNIDQIRFMVGAANIAFRHGHLIVNGETIFPGDAVCMTDDVTPVMAPKIPADIVVRDLLYISAVALDTATNIGEVMAFANYKNIRYAASKLYFNGVEVANGEYMSKSGSNYQVLTAAAVGGYHTPPVFTEE